MSTLSLVIILFGLLIALTRAPLIVAPAATRALYLRFFNTDGRMRALGVLVLAVGALLAWAGTTESGLLADIVRWLGVFMVAMGLVFFILFAGPARRLATSIWSRFSDTALRGLGLLAVIFGLALAAYGYNL